MAEKDCPPPGEGWKAFWVWKDRKKAVYRKTQRFSIQNLLGRKAHKHVAAEEY